MSNNANTYGFAQAANSHSGYDYEYDAHHRHPYHDRPSPGPTPSPGPPAYLDDKAGAPLSPHSPNASSPLHGYGGFSSGAEAASRGGGRDESGAGGGPSYPAYAHYEIPDRSPSRAPLTLTPSRSSRETRDPAELKDGELPEGWTKEDEEAEKEFLKAGLFNWRELSDWRFWIRLEWWCEWL